MASQDTQIACFAASKWTHYLTWFQILAASLGFIALIAMTAGVDLPDHWMHYAKIVLAQNMIGFFVTLLLVHIVLASLLLIGHLKEKPGLLLTWQVYARVFVILVVVMGVWRDAEGVLIISIENIIISVAFWAFMIYVVHVRIYDVRSNRPNIYTV